MEILETIASYAARDGLRYVMIGGHALNFHGFARQTGDIDFMVSRTEKSQWSTLLERLEYKSFQNNDNFARFEASSAISWPIDLMFVSEDTFSQIYESASEGEYGKAKVKVASARHIATLKIHALKVVHPHRVDKDYGDLLYLLRNRKAEFSDEDLEAICLKYASRSLFERIKRDLV